MAVVPEVKVKLVEEVALTKGALPPKRLEADRLYGETITALGATPGDTLKVKVMMVAEVASVRAVPVTTVKLPEVSVLPAVMVAVGEPVPAPVPVAIVGREPLVESLGKVTMPVKVGDAIGAYNVPSEVATAAAAPLVSNADAALVAAVPRPRLVRAVPWAMLPLARNSAKLLFV